MTIDPIDGALKPLPWRRPETLIFATAVVVRLLAAGLWWADTQSDPDNYVGLAENVARGVGFCTPGTANPTAYRPPGYPLILASLINVPGFQRGAVIVTWNMLFDLGTIGLVWSRLRFVSGSMWMPRLAGLLLAVDPLMVRYVALPMTEPCFTYWSTAGVLLLSNVDGWRPRSGRSFDGFTWGLAGALLGFAALCRPSIWPFLGLFIAGSLVQTVWPPGTRARWRARLIELAAFGLGLTLLVAPWVIRNQLVLGRPILMTTHGGYTLLLGNNPVFYDEVARQPWGTVWDGGSLERWQVRMLARMDVELGPDADEYAKDRWQARHALQHIRQDPAGFLAATWYRVRSLWSLAPRGPYPAWLQRGVGLWYALLFAAAIGGVIVMLQRRSAGTWVLLAYIAALQGVHLVYWTDTRMRMPLHPLLAVFAATALDAWRQPRRSP